MDFGPLQIKDTNYVESLECLMVEAIEIHDMPMEVSKSEYAKKVKAVYLDT